MYSRRRQAMSHWLGSRRNNVPQYAAFSSGIMKITSLGALLDGKVVRRPGRRDANEIDAVLAWGRKPSSRRAEAYASAHGLPLLRLEDGFLRSVGVGAVDAPLSIVMDDVGIYYDATGPSRLECLVKSATWNRRTENLVQSWREGRVSKYNHARDPEWGMPEGYVLVVDQTLGDASIQYGMANAMSFRRMLQAAIDENPTSTILLKVHPEVFAGLKRGHFNDLTPGEASRVHVIGEDIHPAGLIEGTKAVYTVTSQMGFEALLWGKPVRTFGMPFYGGWGLTQDELPAPGRRGQATLEALVQAALIDYTRYIDPETGRRCEVETVLAHLALQRRMRGRFPEIVHAVGFSKWKRPIVQAFMQGSRVRFSGKADSVPAGATLVTWGRKPIPGKAPAATRQIRLEDGFLRSVGLGVDLVRPLSWVADTRGIYYDATRESDLEHLLQTTDFDTGLLERATRLRKAIVRHGLTKYNVGRGSWARPQEVARVLLVAGQVESDASLKYGAQAIRTNLDLLCAVRAENQDAHIVYKPHPDAMAGVRTGGADRQAIEAVCDTIVTDAPMAALLEAVDEVHVMTSLAGFEALLRGVKVVTYGQPFYAGWGLTDDRAPVVRRTRRLSLDALVAVALILYPMYVSRTTGRFTTPERALEELITWREQGPATMSLWRRLIRAYFRAQHALRGHVLAALPKTDRQGEAA